MNGVWQKVCAFLGSRMWTGIGVLVGVPALILQMEVLVGRLDNTEEERNTSSSTTFQPKARREPSTPVEFSVRGRVRCPGGGHLFGAEKNSRSDIVEFNAPDSTWITEAHIRTVSNNYGSFGKINFDLSSPDSEGPERKIRAWAPLRCNPPNYPGAPGGWMEVELHGKHTDPSQ